MRKFFTGKRIAAALMMLTLVWALVPTSAFATTWTKLKLRHIGQYDSLSTQQSKSKPVKKTGSYKISMKGGNGIIKFKAPKTGYYSFKFSNLKSSEVDEIGCVVGFCSISGSSYSYKNIKTREGTRPRLPLRSMANGKIFKFDGYKYKSVSTRTGKIKLKKGKVIYVVLDSRDMTNDNVATTVRMKISYSK